MVRWLHRIMSLARDNAQIPEDWQRAVIVPVHKKGSNKLSTSISTVTHNHVIMYVCYSFCMYVHR